MASLKKRDYMNYGHISFDMDSWWALLDIKKKYVSRKKDFVIRKSIPRIVKLLNKYNIKKDQLPKILITDPCVKVISAKVGDIIRIERESPTSGVSIAYRRVVDVVK